KRIRAHVFLCMLAYYVEWHLRQKLAPVLFEDEERAGAEKQRKSIVALAPRSQKALAKQSAKLTEEGWPVHSFRTLLEDLGTLAKNRVQLRELSGEAPPFYVLTEPTKFQSHVFELAGVKP
ncbi:MAG TPA: IS1634 family transposase, partial [Verrucomicrobiales bacterium]|nr:IS1634 family transposase [Verrucomicrobiales bacterium]